MKEPDLEDQEKREESSPAELATGLIGKLRAAEARLATSPQTPAGSAGAEVRELGPELTQEELEDIATDLTTPELVEAPAEELSQRIQAQISEAYGRAVPAAQKESEEKGGTHDYPFSPPILRPETLAALAAMPEAARAGVLRSMENIAEMLPYEESEEDIAYNTLVGRKKDWEVLTPQLAGEKTWMRKEDLRELNNALVRHLGAYIANGVSRRLHVLELSQLVSGRTWLDEFEEDEGRSRPVPDFLQAQAKSLARAYELDSPVAQSTWEYLFINYEIPAGDLPVRMLYFIQVLARPQGMQEENPFPLPPAAKRWLLRMEIESSSPTLEPLAFEPQDFVGTAAKALLEGKAERAGLTLTITDVEVRQVSSERMAVSVSGEVRIIGPARLTVSFDIDVKGNGFECSYPKASIHGGVGIEVIQGEMQTWIPELAMSMKDDLRRRGNADIERIWFQDGFLQVSFLPPDQALGVLEPLPLPVSSKEAPAAETTKITPGELEAIVADLESRQRNQDKEAAAALQDPVVLLMQQSNVFAQPGEFTYKVAVELAQGTQYFHFGAYDDYASWYRALNLKARNTMGFGSKSAASVRAYIEPPASYYIGPAAMESLENTAETVLRCEIGRYLDADAMLEKGESSLRALGIKTGIFATGRSPGMKHLGRAFTELEALRVNLRTLHGEDSLKAWRDFQRLAFGLKLDLKGGYVPGDERYTTEKLAIPKGLIEFNEDLLEKARGLANPEILGAVEARAGGIQIDGMTVTKYFDVANGDHVPNQDAIAGEAHEDGVAWGLVLDGMGGYIGGAEAATACKEEISRSVAALTPAQRHDPDSFYKAVFEGMTLAHAKVRAEKFKEADAAMVLGLAVAVDGKWMLHIMHRADARGYLIKKDGSIRQLTKDFSMVQELVDMNAISLTAAKLHPRRNEIRNGIWELPSPPFMAEERAWETVEVEEGDTVVFTSDGVTDQFFDVDPDQANPESAYDLMANGGFGAGMTAKGTLARATVREIQGIEKLSKDPHDDKTVFIMRIGALPPAPLETGSSEKTSQIEQLSGLEGFLRDIADPVYLVADPADILKRIQRVDGAMLTATQAAALKNIEAAVTRVARIKEGEEEPGKPEQMSMRLLLVDAGNELIAERTTEQARVSILDYVVEARDSSQFDLTIQAVINGSMAPIMTSILLRGDHFIISPYATIGVAPGDRRQAHAFAIEFLPRLSSRMQDIIIRESGRAVQNLSTVDGKLNVAFQASGGLNPDSPAVQGAVSAVKALEVMLRGRMQVLSQEGSGGTEKEIRPEDLIRVAGILRGISAESFERAEGCEAAAAALEELMAMRPSMEPRLRGQLDAAIKALNNIL